MVVTAQSRICPWCLGARRCRVCDGNGDTLLAADEDAVIEVRSTCALCGGSGACVKCQGTGQVAAPAGQTPVADQAGPGSTIHRLLRLSPGSAPHCLCSSQRGGGGTLVDLMIASILLLPLVVIPISMRATRWSWLLLLCVPVAYLFSVCRRQFELHEWMARDLANARAYAGAGHRVEMSGEPVPAPADCRLANRGIEARKLLSHTGQGTWIAQIAPGGDSQKLRATSAAEITERIDEALEDWPQARGGSRISF